MKIALGLRARLALPLVAAAGVLLGAIVWQSLAERGQLRRDAAETLLQKAKLIAARQQSLLARADATISNMMLRPELHPGADATTCARELRELVEMEPEFNQIGLARPDGDIVCAATPPAGRVNVANRAWFRQALQSRALVVSDVVLGRILGKPVVLLAKSIRDPAGRVGGVVYVSIDLTWLHDELGQSGLPAGARLWVIDRQGGIAVRYPDPEGWVGRNVAAMPSMQHFLAPGNEGVLHANGLDGTPRLFGYAPLLNTQSGQLRLFLTVPKAMVEAPADQNFLKNLVVMLGVLAVVAVLLAGSVYRLLVRPLAILARTAASLGAGNLDARSGLRHCDDEIGQLAKTLDDAITERKRAEAEQLAARTMLQTVIDTVPLCIFWKDRQSRYLGCNRTFARLAGTDNPRDLDGKDDYAFDWRAFAHLYQQDDAQVMETGVAKYNIVEPMDLGGGTPVWLETSKVPLRDAQSRVYGVLGVFQDITERKRAVEVLAEHEREYHTLADNVPDNVVRFDADARALYVNPALEKLLGRTAAELCGLTPREMVPGEAFAAFEQAIRQVAGGGENRILDQIIPGADGTLRPHSVRIVAETDAAGRTVSVLTIGRDISEHKRIEEELRLGASVFQNTQEGIIVTDAAAIILSVNPAFSEITGYAPEEALCRKTSLLRSAHHPAEFYLDMWETLLRAGRWQGEVWNRRKSGEIYPQWMTISAVPGDDGKPVRYVSVFHDITEMRRKDEHIRYLAFHDVLTGLPNRALFQERLEHAIERSRREGSRLSVTFLDLDGFKRVNDSHGHDVGDLLLQGIAERIRARLRRGVDTVARLGGDEFVVLMEDLKGAEQCACLAGEIIADIARPLELRGQPMQVGASMGIAFFPEDGGNVLELMQRADIAMYAAKLAGKGTYRVFHADMLDAVGTRQPADADKKARQVAGSGNGGDSADQYL